MAPKWRTGQPGGWSGRQAPNESLRASRGLRNAGFGEGGHLIAYGDSGVDEVKGECSASAFAEPQAQIEEGIEV